MVRPLLLKSVYRKVVSSKGKKVKNMPRKTVLSEQAMQRLERNIPELAGGAFLRAYQLALSLEGKVLEAVNGQLVETSADGTQRFVKELRQPIPVVPGTKRVLVRRK